MRTPRPWDLPESAVTPERVYLDRRQFLRKAGVGALGLAAMSACELSGQESPQEGRLSKVPPTSTAHLYPAARRDPRFDPGSGHGVVTEEKIVAGHNNFYEFSTDKEAVWRLVDRFQARPWQIEVGGLVERPFVVDLTELERTMPLEERIYRLRCVEAWSVVVPWIGFPLAALLKKAEPVLRARYVRFVSFSRPEEAPGQKRQTWYPWPYYEALRIDEAMNELAFLATGMYGHPLQKQNGAPIRLAVPWKYGYKSIKSIVRIELSESRPPTFWNDVVPDEYGFLSNVDPSVPHPRWSQATEIVVATGERIPTLPFNGYAEWVAGLYG